MAHFESFNYGCKSILHTKARNSKLHFFWSYGFSTGLTLILAHSAKDVFKYFFDLEDLSKDEFLVCRHLKYPFSIRLPTSMREETEDVDLQQSWASLILASDLAFGYDARWASWEVYGPYFTVCQQAISRHALCCSSLLAHSWAENTSLTFRRGNDSMLRRNSKDDVTNYAFGNIP